MIPRSISASSLDSAGECLARWKATSFDRGNGTDNPAALLGTTLHAALEQYLEPVRNLYIQWEWSDLLEEYNKAFLEVFGPNGEKDWYNEGKEILLKWYSRTYQYQDLTEVDILSREVKKNFPVPYTDPVTGERGTVQFNYIMDRFDRLDLDCYRVVDYKSQRSPLRPEELKMKMQPRAYALAAQIEFPDAKEIWVQFDFLRYSSVAILFTRQDNIETWKLIKDSLQRIVNTPDTHVPETLNPGCRYCPRKYVCSTLQRNIAVGGIHSLDVEGLAGLHYRTKGQLDALKSVVEDVEGELLAHALRTDQLEFETEEYGLRVASYKRRVIDRDKMAQILGPELMAEYGRLNVGDLDKIRNDPRVTPIQASMLDTAVDTVHSDPSIKIIKKVV